MITMHAFLMYVEKCSIDCLHGECTDENTCVCHSGWKGERCTEAICFLPDGCLHGGRCIEPGHCSCAYGYNGFKCQISKLSIEIYRLDAYINLYLLRDKKTDIPYIAGNFRWCKFSYELLILIFRSVNIRTAQHQRRYDTVT